MHEARAPSPDEVLQVARRAGIASLRPLQERLIPLIFKGRDIAVQVSHGSGKTMAVMLPLVLGLRGAGQSTNAVILSHSTEEVGKAARAHARVARVVRDAPPLVVLGEEPDARREQRRLERGAVLVAGTVERVIDHLRRGTLTFTDVQVVVVVEPEEEGRGDFARDVQFIFARMPERRQTILFSPGPPDDGDELSSLLRHPLVIEATAPAAGSVGPRRLRTFSVAGQDRALALLRILLSGDVTPALVIHSSRPDGERIVGSLRQAGLRVGSLAPSTGSRSQMERSAALGAFSRRELDVLVVPAAHGPQDLRDLTPSHVVLYDLHGEGARLIAGLPATASVIVLADPNQERELARLQEAIGVTMNNEALPGTDAVLDGVIDRMLLRMKQEDKAQLSRLRARIRKRVPLLQRPLLLASLLRAQLPPGLLPLVAAPGAPAAGAEPRGAAPPRDALRGRPGRGAEGRPEPGRAFRGPEGGRPPRAEASAPGRPPRAEASAPGRPPRAEASAGRPREGAGQRPAAPRQAGPARQAATAGRAGQSYAQLFVSIGRNRRVFARDLSDHFASQLRLAPGDIGGVRVFDKYSFVDIAAERAEEAIARLSGSELKGRTITVNYAKKKEEKEE